MVHQKSTILKIMTYLTTLAYLIKSLSLYGVSDESQLATHHANQSSVTSHGKHSAARFVRWAEDKKNLVLIEKPAA